MLAVTATSRSPELLLRDLLAHSYDGPQLAYPVFIAQYRHLWKPLKLLEHVISTYNDALSLKNTREACVNLLIHWIEARLIPDFFSRGRRAKVKKGRGKAMQRLLDFMDSLERRSHTVREFSSGYTLKLALLRTWSNRRRAGCTCGGPQQRLESLVEQPAVPVTLPLTASLSASASSKEREKDKDKQKDAAKENKRLFLVHIWVPDPRNIALRLTLVELNMFRKISPRELLGLTWRNRHAPHPANNVLELIARSNNVSFWVAARVVKRKSIEKRVDMITKFLELAAACVEMHNYNTLMEILGGLNSHSVSRLRKTWEKLPSNAKETFDQLSQIMESKGNYRAYRNRVQDLRLSGSFYLPYLGVYLRDLVTLDEAMPTKRDHGINVEKFNMIINLLLEVDYAIKQEPKALVKRAGAVMRGLNDQVAEGDLGVEYLQRVQGFSESELLRLSQLVEPPRQIMDADLTRDESIGSSTSVEEGSAWVQNGSSVQKSSGSSAQWGTLTLTAGDSGLAKMPSPGANGSARMVLSKSSTLATPQRSPKGSERIPKSPSSALSAADASSPSSTASSEKSM